MYTLADSGSDVQCRGLVGGLRVEQVSRRVVGGKLDRLTQSCLLQEVEAEGHRA